MSKFCPLKGFDHLKFYVGNAKQVEHFHSQGCGFTNTADRGLETGDRQRASYEMKQDNLRLLLSTGLNPDYAIDQSAISLRASEAGEAWHCTIASIIFICKLSK